MLMTSVVCLVLLGTCLGVQSDPTQGVNEDEVLYNGIRLESPWPPRRTSISVVPPPPPPYLVSPPAVIPIDVGRQLFVDDFLIEQTDLRRSFHLADQFPGNPVLKPDRPWEDVPPNPSAAVFSDGVWYDPADRILKMWYAGESGPDHLGAYKQYTCYAISVDGVHWEKPELDIVAGTNIVVEELRDSALVWLDLEEEDPDRRYKFFSHGPAGEEWRVRLRFSPDGIHWSEPVARGGPSEDRSTAFWNPFRQVWIYSLKWVLLEHGRMRVYWESSDVVSGMRWEAGDPVLWVAADELDPPRPDLQTPCQLYNLDRVAYESLILGLFTIWRGHPADRNKINEVVLGYSRDGFHWYRPDRRAFIGVSEQVGDWNWCNVQSAGGGCLIVGDQLWFYFHARSGVPGTSTSGVSATGLATLRRDGFASMDNLGERTGTLTTRPVKFSGKHLFVNADADQGELRVEIVDRRGRVIAPFSADNCKAVRSDKTLEAVTWIGANDLARLEGRPVKFRFYLRNGHLYSFWVSPDKSGASHGYVAAGGPGFTGPRDTVGSAACR